MIVLLKPQLSFAAAAVIAMLVPFFVDVVGLLGSLGFWPLTVFLPIQMHIAQTGESSSGDLVPLELHCIAGASC